MDEVARMLVAGRRRYARAAKDFPLAHALFALATFVAACDKVLAETPDTKLDLPHLLDNSTSGRAASFFWNAVAQRPPSKGLLVARYTFKTWPFCPVAQMKETMLEGFRSSVRAPLGARRKNRAACNPAV